MKRLTVLLAGAAGMLLAPAAAQASVNVAWSPQTGGGSFDFGTVKITQALGQRFRRPSGSGCPARRRSGGHSTPARASGSRRAGPARCG